MPKNLSDEKNVSVAAIPIRRDTLRKARLELGDLPVAQFKNDGVETKLVLEELAKASEEVYGEAKDSAAQEVQTSSRTPAFIQPPAQKGSSLNRKALESTNRGIKPSSRRFVRGILHPSFVKVSLAAFFAILVRVALVGAIILGAFILLDKVDLGLAWYLLVLPLVALLHFATVGQARCRVCGVKEFVPSGSNKHVKTHRFLFTGPIMSTALHLLIFKWFHCMFCGTAIRIKK